MIDTAAATDVKVLFVTTSVSFVPLEPRILRNYNLPPGVTSKYTGDANFPGWCVLIMSASNDQTLMYFIQAWRACFKRSSAIL